MDKTEIATNLRRFLDANHLTQEQFARLINAPLSSVSCWLHGKRHMSKVWQQVLQSKKILPQEKEADLPFHFESRP